MIMKEGFLSYDENIGRYDVVFMDGSRHGGLYCGDTFEVFRKNSWVSTRIEYSASGMWYLAGLDRKLILNGLRVRNVRA